MSDPTKPTMPAESRAWLSENTGRPPKPASEHRAHKVTLLFTEGELERLREKAEAAGKKTAVHARDLVLGAM